jgi:predicted cupin superfamily sugar epimerase
VRELIDSLKLTPHPEGGHFGEVHRSRLTVSPDDDRGVRASLTVIYFLLARGERSAWHEIASDEVWHHCEGDTLDLLVIDPETMSLEQHVLGPGGTPLAPVPAGHWQAARTRGAYTLVSCVVGPGFDYHDFRLLRDDAATVAALRGTFPQLPEMF